MQIHCLVKGHTGVIIPMCVMSGVLFFCREYLKLVQREVAFVHSLPLNVIVEIVGWIYFLAWSISFYPQVRLLRCISIINNIY